MPPRCLSALIALCATFVAAGSGKEATFPSNEQMRHLRSLEDPQLSPDGRRALLQVHDAAADGGKSHLWLLDVDGGMPRQLTFSPDADKQGEHSAQWMPDGQSIIFEAHRSEHTDLFILPMSGGEARALEIKVRPTVDASRSPDALPPAKPGESLEKVDELPVDIGDYRVSPDGVWIALLVHDPETPGEKKQKEAKADAEWIDHDPHGTRLYLLRRATNQLTAVPISINVRLIAWKDDSSALIAVAEGNNHASDLGPSASSWRIEVADPDHPQRIAALPATINTAMWSADGRSIIYTAQSPHDTPPYYLDLYVLDIQTGKTRNLTDGLDGSLSYENPVALFGGGVLQLVARGLDVAAIVYATDSGKPTYLHMPISAVDRVRTNAHQSGWLFLGSGGGQQPALYYAADLTGTVKRLETPSVSPEHLLSATPKRIHWKNEGLTIEGLLYLPPEAANHIVPLIVDVHGGPMGNFSDRFAPYVDFLIGHGWAVLRPNPRGSTGRGATFVAANKNDLGGGDYRDIMSGVDYVLKTEHLDVARMALIGYSYGGEMAGFVEGKTTRFKAIVSGAPVIDQYSEYGTEGESWYDRWYYGKPWEHPGDAWRQSPLAHVGSARTPLLLLQGQADTNDPLGQAQEMYRALRQNGVPVSLVVYPRDDHGPLSRALDGTSVTEPWHGFDARRRVESFLQKAFDSVH
jgi:dipeptidyl aminopeptidase/acylaminoacyl peptidase